MAEDIEHMRDNSEGIQEEAVVELFRMTVMRLMDVYCTEHKQQDMPVTIIDFACDLIYGVGRRDQERERLLRDQTRNYPPNL